MATAATAASDKNLDCLFEIVTATVKLGIAYRKKQDISSIKVCIVLSALVSPLQVLEGRGGGP